MRYLDCPTCGATGRAISSTHYGDDRGHRWQASDWERERMLAARRAANEIPGVFGPMAVDVYGKEVGR